MGSPFRTAAAAMTLAFALGGCQTTFDLVGVAVPLSAHESRQYNGSYQGSVRQVFAKGPGCPTENAERVLMVGDGVLWYAYTPVVFFASPIDYDGKVDSVSGNTHMTGQVTGNHLDATVESPLCKTQLSMDFVYNHS